MKAIAFPIMITGALIAAIINPGELVQKTKVLADNSRVTYNVNDKNKLDGAYFVENTQRNVWLRGTYKEEKKSGNWYAFNSDKTVFMRYNYDLKKMLYLDTVAIKKAEISITDKNDEAAKNASAPLPVCSIDQYLSILGQAAKVGYPKENLVYNQPIDITIVAKIKSSKDVSYAVNYTIKGVLYAYTINNRDIDLNIDWIPSTYNGKEVEAEFKVPTKIIFNENGSGMKRFVWNY
ncbi:hypothetical protein EZ428_16575 [Pedobacter frigiditerrae]|uniref:DUF3108 domain-containing protein n=1 Tax=Pedobacter frigiditerrae TaxID=2530452 RepID=A0A4R0MQW6_9SPHI|nr:hypothetical protein [Pedobacter frigiditerrae]TCC89309.1 hypothetical protein EZ428_16575 [Pedobacter frigiditerrae]